MKKLIFAIVALLSTNTLGQQYGVTNYKVNGQAVASQYNYSVLGPTTLAAGAGTITINPSFCSVIIGSGRTFTPTANMTSTAGTQSPQHLPNWDTATSCSDVTHTVAFVAGDVISIQFTTQAAETLAAIKASVVAQ